MRFFMPRVLALAALFAAPAAAQVGLPQVQVPGLPTRDILQGTLEPARATLRAAADRLLDIRNARVAQLVRQNRTVLELDREGEPARKGEILAIDPSPVALSTLGNAGFYVIGQERIEGLDLSVTRIGLPAGVRLRDVDGLISRVAPGLQWAPDHVYAASGRGGSATGAAPARRTAIATPVGMIDGAPGKGAKVAAVRGFARGAPHPSNHGSAVASLLTGAGVRTILAADVYGRDPAGGNALAIAQGLGWLTGQGAKVVTVSLVGPDNRVLSRAIGAARSKGVVIVAPVGNDGPAAPAAYPASYEGVVAVTGVDRRNRALIEAGRALHLDYAAPGADIAGANAAGKQVKLRGTSFAAPLAAARIAAALDGGSWRRTVDSEAIDLGERGPDPVYGRGLVCADCR